MRTLFYTTSSASMKSTSTCHRRKGLTRLPPEANPVISPSTPFIRVYKVRGIAILRSTSNCLFPHLQLLHNGRRRSSVSPNRCSLPTVCCYNRFVTLETIPPLAPGDFNSRLLTHSSPIVGRDKLLRTLQYFSRFYAWYLLRTNSPVRFIAPWEAIKKQFGLSRKLLRVGKNVEHFKAAAMAADSKTMDPVLKYCAVGRQLGYAMYLSFDMIAYVKQPSYASTS